MTKVAIAVNEGWIKSDESLRQWKLLKDELRAYCRVVVVFACQLR